jgi:hypothetical protein
LSTPVTLIFIDYNLSHEHFTDIQSVSARRNGTVHPVASGALAIARILFFVFLAAREFNQGQHREQWAECPLVSTATNCDA